MYQEQWLTHLHYNVTLIISQACRLSKAHNYLHSGIRLTTALLTDIDKAREKDDANLFQYRISLMDSVFIFY